MTSPKSLVALASAVLGVASLAHAQLPSGNWSVRFADEFNAAHAGNPMGLDPDKWNPAYPWTRVHNYPAYIRDENIRVNAAGNGLLQLHARRENFNGQPFTSGAVNTNGLLNLGLVGRGGYMEARLRLPNFNGAWPAFWALQEGWPPEIDIMEFVKNNSDRNSNSQYVANAHFRNPNGTNGSSWSGFKEANVGDLTAGFHNYGVKWTDSRLDFYVDGNFFHGVNNANAVAQMQQMYLILNLGVGGWPGDPPAGEDVNKSFDIDWVRVWQATGASVSTYAGGSGYQVWDDAAKWTSGAPDLGGQTAVLATPRTGTGGVQTDWNATKALGHLVLRSRADHIVGFADDQLMLTTLGNGGGNGTGGDATIRVEIEPGQTATGTHTIASRVEVHTNARVSNLTANPLTFAADVHGDGALAVDAGRVRFAANVSHTGGTYLAGDADVTIATHLRTPADEVRVGSAAGSNSTLRLAYLPGIASTSLTASHLRIGDSGAAGRFVQSGGVTTITTGELWVGQGAGGVGVFDHDGGSVTVNNWFGVGRAAGNGTYNLRNGRVTKAAAGNLILGSLGGVGAFVQTGGVVEVLNGDTLLGEDGGASGTYTISAGAATLRNVVLSQRGTASGTFNLDGGVVTALSVRRNAAGLGTFNFNGGTLRAAASSVAFMQGLSAAHVASGGARIDTNGFDVTIAQPLIAAAGSTGGLTKLGAGTLTLAGANAFAGDATVTAGRLVVGHARALGVGRTVVAAGGTLALSPALADATIVRGLDVAGGGRVEVNAGGLVIDHDAAEDVLAGFIDDLAAGRIVSSLTATDARVRVGYAVAGELGLASFGGAALDASAVVVDSALAGDANLNGTVGFDDLVALAQSYGTTGTGVWTRGDFDYDRSVAFGDLVTLAQNYGATPGGPSLAGVADDAFRADWALAQALVPEPMSLAALMLVATPRRRRRTAR